jgi:hypothetical protein
MHMTARIAHIALALALCTAAAAAQVAAPEPPRPAQARPVTPKPAPPQPAPAPAPETPQAARAPGRNYSLNVRVEVTITEQRGKAAPTRKLVSIMAADGFRNAIRSMEEFFPPLAVPLNIDVMPDILDDGKIRLQLNLEYELPGSQVKPGSDGNTERTMTKSSVRENLFMILESGKPLVAARSADPVSDRQVTVEVLATIVK